VKAKGDYDMLDVQEMQKKVDKFRCWDAGILEITSEYFGDEVRIRMEDDETHDIILTFLGCDRVEMQHWFGYPKFRPIKNYTRRDLPYFVNTIAVSAEEHEGIEYYVFDMVLHPMYIKVYCRDLDVKVVENLSRLNDKDSVQ
jgi:hypothetical protein